MERDDNSQQQFENDQEQEWKEMMAELENYLPFKEQFNQFVVSHERNENVKS